MTSKQAIVLDSSGGTTVDRTTVAQVSDHSTERICAFSQAVLLYTLKKASDIRILWKVSIKQKVFTQHTAPVHRIAFASAVSGTIASASAKELICWYVGTEDTEPSVYFSTAPTVPMVRGFEWFFDFSANAHAMLLVYGNAVGTLQCRDLVPIVKDVETGPPKEEKTVTADAFRAFPHQVDPDVTLISVGSGHFAIATSADKIVTCTSKNPATPAWKPSGAGTIASLKLMTTSAMLLVGMGASVHIFDVAGEPRPLLTVQTTAPVVLMAVGGPRAAVFDAAGRGWMLAIDGTAPLAVRAATYVVGEPDDVLSPSSAVWVQGDSTMVFRMSVQTGDIGFIVVRGGAWKAIVAPPTPPTETPPKVPTTEEKSRTTANPSFPSLRSPALPLAGGEATSEVVANVVEQTLAEITATHQVVANITENTKQVVALSAKSLMRDYEALLRVALEAHVSELQSTARSRPSNGGGSGGKISPDAVVIMERLSQSIVTGMSEAIEAAVAASLETLRPVVVKAVHRLVREAHRERIDALLKDSADNFTKEVEKAKRQHEQDMNTFAAELTQIYNKQVQQVIDAATSLQEQLIAITHSGILEEVAALREQVRRLAANRTDRSAPAAAPLPVESLIDQAIALGTKGDFRGALRIVAAASVSRHYTDAAVAVRFAKAVKEREMLDKILTDSTIPAREWASFAVCLASPSNAEDVPICATILDELLAEREDLSEESELKSAVHKMAQTWKDAKFSDASVQRTLRKLRRLIMPQ